jgi:hypothetical protein
MGEIVEAFALLVIKWRIGLSVLGSIIAAVFLASALPWFSGLYGIGLVLVSFGAGLLWQGSAEAAQPARSRGRESSEKSDA